MFKGRWDYLSLCGWFKSFSLFIEGQKMKKKSTFLCRSFTSLFLLSQIGKMFGCTWCMENQNKAKLKPFTILFANNLLCLSRSHMLGREIHTWTSRRKLTLFLMGFIQYLIAMEKTAMEHLSNPTKKLKGESGLFSTTV